MTPHDLLVQWRTTADTCARFGATTTADAIRQCAAELEAALAAPQPVTLQAAALASGYSVDHLGRLVRQGALRNYGRKGAPRVALGELPRRLSPPNPAAYDPLADARTLRTRRRAG